VCAPPGEEADADDSGAVVRGASPPTAAVVITVVVACCKSDDGTTKARGYSFMKRSEKKKLTSYLELKKSQYFR